jgi:undecaprenyl-diphosphatase
VVLAASKLAAAFFLCHSVSGHPAQGGAGRSSMLAPILLALVLAAAVANVALTIVGAFTPLNRALTAGAYHFEPGWLTPLMVVLTLLGEDPPLDLFALALALWAYHLRERLYAFAMVCIAVAARTIAAAMKYVIQQPRPFLHVPPHPLSVLHGYGYPSGHAFLSTAILGFGAAVLWHLLSRRPARWFVVMVCTLLIFGIGWSRVYLGFHWVNDVIGGYLGGAAIALGGWTLQDRIRMRRNVSA